MSQRVLIVEDEALIALDLAFSLEALGHQVIATASDSEEAIDAARDGVDLALVDLNLRDGCTGPRLGETLARDYGATVIYVTANPRQVEAAVEGPVGIMPKPFTQSTLEASIRFALAIREGRLEAPPAELKLLAGALTTIEGPGRQARL